jgi:hypothetical protein
VRDCRETLSAVAHGGNPQDRAASPRHCPPQPTGVATRVAIIFQIGIKV